MHRGRTALTLVLLAIACGPVGARTIRTAHFVVTLAETAEPSTLGESLEAAYRRVREYGLRLPASIAVTVHRSTTDFATAGRTSRTSLAAVRGVRLHLQPLSVLARQPGVDAALAHELVHVALAATADRLPRWLAEGLAMNVAAERLPTHGSYSTARELDRALAATTSHAGSRRAYGTAERLVRSLTHRIGRDRMIATLAAIDAGAGADEAFRMHAGIDLARWVSEALATLKAARNRARR